MFIDGLITGFVLGVLFMGLVAILVLPLPICHRLPPATKHYPQKRWKGIKVRINVYSQELTKEVSVVSKKAADTGITYHGVRLYLHSPELLHHTEEDDDRSAITFWIPHAESFTPADLAAVFRQMADQVEQVETN